MSKCTCAWCTKTHQHDQESRNDEVTNNYAPFILTHAEYDRIAKHYTWLMENNGVIEIDRDETHVIGKLRTDSLSKQETHDYYVLQDITHLDLKNLQNAWFTPSGKILYVPWYGHNLTACILGHVDKYADALENMGWLHYSIGVFRNMKYIKVTDRMYDAIANFADQNGKDAARLTYDSK